MRSHYHISFVARAGLLLAAAGTLLPVGCTRKFWRKQADRDVYNLLAEKLNDDRWLVPRLEVTPDPRSRFYDPYDLDRGPLPPDDESANKYMHQAGAWKGYKGWHKFGRALSIENPHWLEPYGLSAEALACEPAQRPPLPKIENLTLQDALELSYIHSRDYQQQIEAVYIEALNLTFQRFQFDVRYLGIGGRRPGSDVQYDNTPSVRDDLRMNKNFGVSQVLPSGAQWIVELANNTLWMFSGPDTLNTASAISYSLTQPLLFQAGRKVVMEDLTQAERSVLYSVRDLQRFRRIFFARTVAGNSGFLSLLQQRQLVINREGNVRRVEQQLETLQALASQRTGVYFEDLAAFPADALVPPNLAGQLRYDAVQKRLYWRGGMTAAQRTTLLGLSADPAFQTAVRSLVQLRVYEPLDAPPADLKIPPALTGQLLFEADEKRLYWQGPMTDRQATALSALNADPAWQTAVNRLISRMQSETLTQQVLQLKSRLLGSQNNLRSTRVAFQNTIDQFKQQLGLPPDMEITIDLSLLDQFYLIDPKLFEAEEAIKEYVNVWALLDENNPDPTPFRRVVDGLRNLEQQVLTGGLRVVTNDLQRVRMILGERLKQLNSEEERQRVRRDIERDEELLGTIRGEFREFSENLADLLKSLEPAVGSEVRVSALGVTGQAARVQFNQGAFKQIADLREKLLKLSQSLQVIQIGLRTELIKLAEFAMSMENAVRRALENRLDLKNLRAQVMDARRALEVAANQLEAVLNLRVEGDIRTRVDPNGRNIRPFDFRGRQSSYRVGIGFTAPLDQVNARNVYRTAQITFQRARRDYMALEDQIKADIRSQWRTLSNFRENFETARQAVRISAVQFDNAVESAQAPGQPPTENSAAGLNLLTALDSVLQAQDSLIGLWVNYEQTRINIYRDMGIMDVDPRGLWDDEFYQRKPAGDKKESTPQGPPPPPLPAPAARKPNHEKSLTQGPGKPPLGNVGSIDGSQFLGVRKPVQRKGPVLLPADRRTSRRSDAVDGDGHRHALGRGSADVPEDVRQPVRR